MRLMTYQRYTYTARMFDWTIENDANGTRAYFDAGDVKIEFAGDSNAPRVVILSKKPLRKFVQLTNIRNRRGDYIMADSVYTVTLIEPIVSVFGDLEGYKMQAALSTEGDFAAYA